jgi:hypothetical protein
VQHPPDLLGLTADTNKRRRAALREGQGPEPTPVTYHGVGPDELSQADPSRVTDHLCRPVQMTRDHPGKVTVTEILGQVERRM